MKLAEKILSTSSTLEEDKDVTFKRNTLLDVAAAMNNAIKAMKAVSNKKDQKRMERALAELELLHFDLKKGLK